MKMIKLSDTHYIIVDDSEIKDGDFVTNGVEIFLRESMAEYSDEYANKYWQKITHSTTPIEPIEDSEVWENGEHIGPDYAFQEIKPLSLSGIEEVVYGYNLVEMAQDYTEKWCGKRKVDSYIHNAFKSGFKAHKELVKDKLFTVEDMRRIYEKGYSSGRNELNSRESDKVKNDYIQSLLPKTEWEVEFDENGKIKLI